MVTKLFRNMQVDGLYMGEQPKVFDVELEIDEAGILKQLGGKARRNKSKRSAAMSGAVKVRLYAREES